MAASIEAPIKKASAARGPGKELLFVSSMPASRSNAIGLQTLYFANVLRRDWRHVYWDIGMGESDAPHSKLLKSAIITRWPFAAGRGFVTRQVQRFGFDWWRGDRLSDSGRLRLRVILSNTGFAYLAPLRNSEATKCRGIVETAGCPFVVHLWDLLDATMNSDFAWLFSHAERVFCLSSIMAEDVRATAPCQIDTLPFIRPASKFKAQFHAGGALNIALIGFLSAYQDGLALLDRAIAGLRKDFNRICLRYIGPSGQLKYLPDSLLEFTEYVGFLDDDGRDRALANCQFAYLPGPLLPPQRDLRSRYSIPSRTADYLAVGLPVVAAVNLSSATAAFFSPIRDRAVFFADNAEEARCAMRKLADEELWSRAAQEGAAFFDKHFNSANALAELISIVDRFI